MGRSAHLVRPRVRKYICLSAATIVQKEKKGNLSYRQLRRPSLARCFECFGGFQRMAASKHTLFANYDGIPFSGSLVLFAGGARVLRGL